MDGRIDAGKGDELLVGPKAAPVAHLRKKRGGGDVIDAVNRCEDLEILLHGGLTKLDQRPGQLSQALVQVLQRCDLAGQDHLLGKADGRDGVPGRSPDRLRGYGDAFSLVSLLKGMADCLGLGHPDESGRGEDAQELQHRVAEDIPHVLKLREGGLQKPLDLVFYGTDHLQRELPLPGEIFEVLMGLQDRKRLDGVSMREDKSSDRECILAVSLCLSQRQPAEVCDHQGVDDQGSNPLGAEKREEIEVVATGGFHGDHGIAQSDTVRGDCFEEFGKTGPGHPGGQRKGSSPLRIKTGYGKGILGDIDTDKESLHRITSMV